MTSLQPVILSGGSGTRLWPLSQPDLPKQFVPFFAGKSLFAMALERIGALPDAASPIVVTGTRHVDLVRRETSSAQVRATVIVEPAGRNTTAAIVAAALIASSDDILVVLPSDHLIADHDAFVAAVGVAAKLAGEGAIVTFGIKPDRPETGYGYIALGEPVDGGFTVANFKEKPPLESATQMAEDGRHFWNSGMFVVTAGRAIEEVGQRLPDLLAGVKAAMPDDTGGNVELAETFAEVEPVSFDHSVMEATDRAVVVPFDAGWDDVGSYQSLLAASDVDEDGNFLSGDVKAVRVKGSYVVAQSRRVVIAGLEDVVVVETPDDVLVVPLDHSQDVRSLRLREELD